MTPPSPPAALGLPVRALWIACFLACVLFAPLSIAQEGNAPSAEEEEDGPAAEDQQHFQALLVEREEAVRRSAQLETDASSAIGDDRVALRAEALSARLVGATTLSKMHEAIARMEERGEEIASEKAALAALLPPLEASIQADYQAATNAVGEAKKKLQSAADDAARVELEQAIQRGEELIRTLLGAGIDVVNLSEALGIPADAERAWLVDRLQARGRIAASHTQLALRRQADTVALAASEPDPATANAAISSASRAVTQSLDRLEAVVDLMERVELDTAAYHQILVQSTGEITVDAIDSEVAGELAARWASELREGAAENGPRYIFQALLFILIASLFFALSRFVRRIVARIVDAPHLRFSQLLKRMVVSLSSGLVLIIGLLIAMSQLGIEVAPMLAGLGIAGFVLGFALQDTLGNFAAGVMILVYRPFDVADMIDCAGGVFGRVSNMSLVATTILTIDNKTLIVPNSKIWGDVITNVTAQANRRVDLEFGIGYGDDIATAEKVIWSVIEEHPRILKDPEPVVKVHSLGDSSVNFVVRPWVARDDYWDIHWDLTREIKLRFDREGVSIPFPQRDVHFYPAAPAPSAPAARSEKLVVGTSPEKSHDVPEAEET